MVLQPQQGREFLLVQFFHALGNVVSQDEVEEGLLLVVEFGIDVNPGVCCANLAVTVGSA